ncbi:uncharacterized protein LOC113227958 [Hyposmocoma kahamanoa]|uniref:uncharacterized protein LOC113227958 n=1 Tax=Hyposmocoma kahamanoa TaxID=1477025 RepID=UPI000E6D7959|nr:uncharacterized protein LOC113227958 [Hyposmocoma kahamanoa]
MQTPGTLPMNNPSASIRPIPQKSLGNFEFDCVCKKELNHKNQPGNCVDYRPLQCHPHPPPQHLPYPPPQRLSYPPPQHPQPLQSPPRYSRPPPLSPAIQIKQEGQECSEGCNRYAHDKILKAVKKQYDGEIICIHKPPCVLINGCLNLSPNEIRKLQSTAVYSAVQPTKIPLTHNKAVNPGSRNNMKISNVCEKRVENKTPYLPRGQISNNVRRTTHGVNTGTPYYETSKYQSKLKDNPKLVFKTLQIQSIQVETSTNEMETEDGTKIKPDEADIPKNVKSTESKSDMLDILKNMTHPTTPLGDVNTTTTQNEKSMIPETEKHCIALTAVNEISTQVLYKRCISNFRHHTESDVLTKRDITGRQAQEKQRQLICRHHPPCILVHKCIGKQLKDSIIAYEDIPECSHKHCCELIPACLARNFKDVRTVSLQCPPNTCQIV